MVRAKKALGWDLVTNFLNRTRLNGVQLFSWWSHCDDEEFWIGWWTYWLCLYSGNSYYDDTSLSYAIDWRHGKVVPVLWLLSCTIISTDCSCLRMYAIDGEEVQVPFGFEETLRLVPMLDRRRRGNSNGKYKNQAIIIGNSCEAWGIWPLDRISFSCWQELESYEAKCSMYMAW